MKTNPITLWPARNQAGYFASYNEKSDAQRPEYSVARQLGMYASRTGYVEVVVNGSYQGVYVLMEKIKVDNDQVDIADLNETENTGDDLTRGYIIKIDKSTGNNLRELRVKLSKQVISQNIFIIPQKPLQALRKIT
ncbi:MAG: CotH kinase family protein [Cytophagaceae bacterium]|nr:CotH kinase family protein [Cytophagaceae bacterium]